MTDNPINVQDIIDDLADQLRQTLMQKAVLSAQVKALERRLVETEQPEESA